MSLKALFLGLVCSILSAGSFAKSLQNTVAFQKTWLDTEFVEDAFVSVALRNEYQKGEKPLTKWTKPLRIHLSHKAGDAKLQRKLTLMHLSHLRQLIPVPIQLVDSEDKANIRWVFTNQENWGGEVKRLLGQAASDNLFGAICKAGYRLDNTGAVNNAAIIIPVDLAREKGKLVACIVEEITQVLGLPNDSLNAYPSIFNDNTPENLLSPLDVVLIRLLYEDTLQPGMNDIQVRQALKPLLKQYQKSGRLDDAVQIARKSALVSMFGL